MDDVDVEAIAAIRLLIGPEYPFNPSFFARLPGKQHAIKIGSVHEAKVFTRRWLIVARNKDREAKAILKRLQGVTSDAGVPSAVDDFKALLEAKGLLAAGRGLN
jgi:hypothetical protein